MSDQEAIIDLQMRLMDQEQAIEIVSQQLLRQKDEIASLEKKVVLMEMKLAQLNEAGADGATGGSGSLEFDRPPHY